MIALSALAMAVGLLAQGTSAFNPSTDSTRCAGNALCFTSFVWCSQQGDCSYPDYVYPPLNPSARLADAVGILDNVTYEVTWEHADPEYPVQLEWLIPQGNLYPGNSSSVHWSLNLTAGSTSASLNFPSIASTFPTQGFNYTSDNVLLQAASGINLFRLTQPERPLDRANGSVTPAVWIDTSQAFVLLPALTAEFLDAKSASNASQERKWRLGVGIGVGLGVPLLLAVAFFGGAAFGKKKVAGRRGDGDLAAKKISTSS